MNADHPIFPYLEWLSGRQPVRTLKGLTSAYLAYPVAERMEQRQVRGKLAELHRHYRRPFAERLRLARHQLADTVAFAMKAVPYYKDTLGGIGFDPERLRTDIGYLQDIPLLTKDIIREQGDRLLSRPLAEAPHFTCKTGGSTGLSCVIEYDQIAADHAAAVVLYCRKMAGKSQRQSELHFACRFPGDPVPPWPSREDFKCFAMNRSNIFFGALDAAGLDEIWATLQRRRPYLVHGHPSTIYALACHIEKTQGKGKAFAVFESSGELMEDYQRKKIAEVLQCRVVNRYGLAELGVMAYDLDGGRGQGMQLLDSEGWSESLATDNAPDGHQELVFTSFRNRLMPLLRYRSGDLGRVEQRENGLFLTDVVGRLHDIVPINGTPHATHHIQDVLDHRVGGIQEFQIDLRSTPPTLRVVVDSHGNEAHIASRVEAFWPSAFRVEFVQHGDLVRVGRHAKFRHVVTA